MLVAFIIIIITEMHHVMEAGIYSSALKPRVTVVYLDLQLKA